MGFGKGIPGKRFDLPPHFFGNLFMVTGFPAILEKLVDDSLQLLLRPVFSTHGPADHVGIGQVEAGKVMAYLQHILLVNHHAVGLLQLFLHHRMQIFKLPRIVEPENILFHHP